MKNPPFHLSFHIGDYLKKTPGMGPTTFEYHGIYWCLRILAWNTPGCRLPTDPLWIINKLGVTRDFFNEKVRLVLENQFLPKRGFWVDEGLFTEYKRAQKFSLNQSKRAKGLKTKGRTASPGSASSLLPSKKEQQHRNDGFAVGKKKKTRRWESSLLTESDA